MGCDQGLRGKADGQACLWWSQGCSIGCEKCATNAEGPFSPGPFSGFYRPNDPAPYILYGATPAEDVMDALELIREEWEATDGQAAKL